jgi:hypothetical protein
MTFNQVMCRSMLGFTFWIVGTWMMADLVTFIVDLYWIKSIFQLISSSILTRFDHIDNSTHLRFLRIYMLKIAWPNRNRWNASSLQNF